LILGEGFSVGFTPVARKSAMVIQALLGENHLFFRDIGSASLLSPSQTPALFFSSLFPEIRPAEPCGPDIFGYCDDFLDNRSTEANQRRDT